jgi:hypothetical protein
LSAPGEGDHALKCDLVWVIDDVVAESIVSGKPAAIAKWAA